MLKIILYVLLLIMVGCTTGGKNKEPQLASSYQENAILIRAVASKDLNLFDHRKHTLKLAVVQFDKIEDVQNLILSPQGISELLDGDTNANSPPKPKNGNIHVQTFFIAPGTTQTFTMARMAGAKNIMVVAGYYNLTAAGVVRIYEIPIFNNWKPITFWEQTRRMGRIAIFLDLGAQAINYTESTSKVTKPIPQTKNLVTYK